MPQKNSLQGRGIQKQLLTNNKGLLPEHIRNVCPHKIHCLRPMFCISAELPGIAFDTALGFGTAPFVALAAGALFYWPPSLEAKLPLSCRRTPLRYQSVLANVLQTF